MSGLGMPGSLVGGGDRRSEGRGRDTEAYAAGGVFYWREIGRLSEVVSRIPGKLTTSETKEPYL